MKCFIHSTRGLFGNEENGWHVAERREIDGKVEWRCRYQDGWVTEWIEKPGRDKRIEETGVWKESPLPESFAPVYEYIESENPIACLNEVVPYIEENKRINEPRILKGKIVGITKRKGKRVYLIDPWQAGFHGHQSAVEEWLVKPSEIVIKYLNPQPGSTHAVKK